MGSLKKTSYQVGHNQMCDKCLQSVMQHKVHFYIKGRGFFNIHVDDSNSLEIVFIDK
jgi:DNA-binding ferritin-like protein